MQQVWFYGLSGPYFSHLTLFYSIIYDKGSWPNAQWNLNHFFGGGIKFQFQIDITFLKTLEMPWRETQADYESL